MWGFIKKVGRGVWKVAKIFGPTMLQLGIRKFKKRNPSLAWLPDVLLAVYETVDREHANLSDQARINLITREVRLVHRGVSRQAVSELATLVVHAKSR